MDVGTISAIFRESTVASQRAPRLSPGETLRGVVLDVSHEQMKLRIGNSLLNAKLDDPKGSLRHIFENQGPLQADFRVVKNHPHVVLKIKHDTLVPPNSQAAKFARGSLPYQQPLANFFNSLVRQKLPDTDFATKSAMQEGQSDATQVAANLAKRLPVLTQLATASGFKSFFFQSGVMFESLLAGWFFKHHASPRDDFKGQLLRVAAGLQHSRHAAMTADTRVLGEQVESALARIETLQLASKLSSDDQKNLVFFEIPYRSDERVHDIRGYIEQRTPKREGDAASQTSIGLLIQLSSDHSLMAKLSYDSQHLQVSLWSESESIRRAILAGREQFERQLSSQQTTPVSINIARMNPEDFEPVHHFEGLLNDEA